MSHFYTVEENQFLLDHYYGRSYADLTALFNERFNLNMGIGAIKSYIGRYGLTNGRDGRIKPGNVPHNKGVKGVSYPGMKATQFKPGDIPQNYQPIGTESERSDGYVWVKLGEKRWRQKHVAIWEEANGPIPAGHVVVFGDGNPRNFSLDNLILISRRELAVMNKFGLIGGSAELTLAGKAVADLRMKITDRKKGAKRKC